MATERSRTSVELFRYAGLGTQFAAVIGLFAWLGWWADGKLGTSPWLLLVGVFLGFLGGLVSIVKKVAPPRGRRTRSSQDPKTRENPPHSTP
jgi:F0F1-type ATP synthase assembly protein I